MATTVTLKPNAIDISGSTSGTTTLQATAVAGTTTLTLPAATDTLVGKATTDTLTNKTLTGAAMNGTLGATTPSTVAATTLTTSSTVTHNGGTANGVPYLNGSKVLTTGSALVFDGTNLGLGTASPVSQLHIYPTTANVFTEGLRVNREGQTGQYAIVNYASGTARIVAVDSLFNSPSIGFFTSSDGSTQTERARIDSSGNLLVGGTTAGSTSPGIGLTPNGGGSGNGLIYCTGTATTSAASTYFMYSSGAAAYRFYVDFGGTIHATSTSISAISDASLKTNIKDLETGLTEVMALKPRRFDWINGDATNVAGFIAQEVEQVLPELVIDSLYSNDENGNEIKKKNLKMGDILPTLVKAIQEQQAIITTLTARINALESA
jgi:hypothetical protein